MKTATKNRKPAGQQDGIVSRPILFSAPMVRAILADIKTMTRRVVQRYTDSEIYVFDRMHDDGRAEFYNSWETERNFHLPCPYGRVGDQLWVRESCWLRPESTRRDMREGADTWPRVMYAADDPEDAEFFKRNKWLRRNSIHMPRWASRLTLKITDVRVEPLQEISDKDAFAEGIQQYVDENRGHTPNDVRGCWRQLWNAINGDRGFGWNSNPNVWVVEFRKV